MALKRRWEERCTAGHLPDEFQFRSMSNQGQYTEIRRDGCVIASLAVELATLDTLLDHPDPGEVLQGAPAPAHLLVEKQGTAVRWHELEAPP